MVATILGKKKVPNSIRGQTTKPMSENGYWSLWKCQWHGGYNLDTILRRIYVKRDIQKRFSSWRWVFLTSNTAHRFHSKLGWPLALDLPFLSSLLSCYITIASLNMGDCCSKGAETPAATTSDRGAGEKPVSANSKKQERSIGIICPSLWVFFLIPSTPFLQCNSTRLQSLDEPFKLRIRPATNTSLSSTDWANR